MLARKRPEEGFKQLSKSAEAYLQASRAPEAASLIDEFLTTFPEHRTALSIRAEIAEKSGYAQA